MLSRCDFVVLCLPLSEETRTSSGTRSCGPLRRDAVLINVSRGGTVDPDAPARRAPRGAASAGAGLDVFEPEPLPDGHPLFDLENAVLTPHLGGWVEESLPRLASSVARDMLSALRGERPVRLANPEVWERPGCRAHTARSEDERPRPSDRRGGPPLAAVAAGGAARCRGPCLGLGHRRPWDWCVRPSSTPRAPRRRARPSRAPTSAARYLDLVPGRARPAGGGRGDRRGRSAPPDPLQPRGPTGARTTPPLL